MKAKKKTTFIKYTLFSLAMMSFALPHINANASSQVKVRLNGGVTFEGEVEKSHNGTSIKVFKGIEYAKAKRWSYPKLYNYPKGNHTTKKFGAVCPQNTNGAVDPEIKEFANTYGMKEDCLNLNIWTKSHNPRAKLPTFVWIHGGGFKSGVAYKKVYQGANMAAKGAVFVSLNYRLNLFGFFAHKGQTKNEPKGNYGIFDQIEALKWIQKNITRFGGDPRNVTLIGESAGAVSVLTHLQNQSSNHLFHKAIVQSAPALLLTTPIDGTNKSENPTAMESSALLAQKLKCSVQNKAQELNCLKRKSMTQIVNLAAGPIHSGLFMDNITVKKSFHQTFSMGQFQNKPLIIGTNKDEATFFGAAPFRRPIQYKYYLFSEFGRKVARDLIRAYPANNNQQMQSSWVQFYTDFLFTFDALAIASSGSRRGYRNIYHYYFSRVGPGAELSGKGASHGFEIAYFLDNLNSIGAPSFAFDHLDDDIATEMSERLFQFAKSGKPSFRKGVAWSPYNNSSRETLEINTRIQEKYNILKSKMIIMEDAKRYKLLAP